ncbi:DUF2800 domain-containing protein [Bacillus licheniformis]|nr:DUF2800 domain-containing protein [Bacillus licheniformis]
MLYEAEELKRWAKDVQDYALSQAENHGKRFPGWKLVEGRSIRKYADKTEAAAKLLEAGYSEDKADQLLAWAEEFVKPRAEMAAAGEGEFISGDHCRFCRARFTCRKRAEANLELAKYDFKAPELLSEEVAIGDNVMEIIDLKYGKGVPVSAQENTQMRLYALGAINQFGMLYDIETVRMTIIQPRLDSVSTDEIRTRRLNKLKKHELFSKSMLDYVTSYADLVVERINALQAGTRDATILFEQRLDYSEWVPEGFGTGDVMADHSSRAHALLSASGSKRWLTCTPSARLEQEFEESTSVFAEEGTLAHELSEVLLQYHFGQISKTARRATNP